MADSGQQPTPVSTSVDSASQRAANTSVFPLPAAFSRPAPAKTESQAASTSVFPMPAELFGRPPGVATPAIVNQPASPPSGAPPIETHGQPPPPPEEKEAPPAIQATAAATGGCLWLTWLQTAGSVTLSTALHAMVLVTLASWTILFPPEEEVIPTLASLGEDEQVELTALEQIEVEIVEVDVEEMSDVPRTEFEQVTELLDDPAVGDITGDIGLDSVGSLGNLDGLLGKVGGGLGGNGNGAGMREFNRRLKREGAMTGEVQISLIWEGYNDLDLHVLTPGGVEISWQNRTDRLGKLDVDMNADRMSREPVENIFWPVGKAPRGKYMVGVHHFASRGGPRSVPFELAIKVDGKVETIKGVAVVGQPMQVVHTLMR